MREGYIAVQYTARTYDDHIEIEEIDRDYIVNYSGLSLVRRGVFKSVEKVPLAYQPQNFIDEEFSCHFEQELTNFLETQVIAVEGIYYTFFKFTINWSKSPDTPDGPGEYDSELMLEMVDHEVITTDVKVIEDFFIEWNKHEEETRALDQEIEAQQ